MPRLEKLPEHIDEYIYESVENSLPKLSKYKKSIFNSLKLPIPFFIIRKLLIQSLHLPASISFLPGFNCLAGRLFCGEDVGLGNTFFVDYEPIYIGNNVRFSFRNFVITSTPDLKDFNRIIAKSIIIEDNA
jgi:hypothetical protein